MPETSYASCGDLSLAYQVSGDGPADPVPQVRTIEERVLRGMARLASPAGRTRDA